MASLPNGDIGSYQVGADVVKESIQQPSSINHHQDRSSETLDSDLLYTIKKRWTQFWNEPEIMIENSSTFTNKDGLK